ncbi:MAG: hypothetical protein VYD70_08090 [Planctomycetota bacterium]|nr:hypothetical protein [Planctomycetota bacterium]
MLGALVQVASIREDAASDGVVTVFGEPSLWLLIPIVLLALWIALRIAVSRGVFVTAARTGQVKSSDGGIPAGNGVVESNLPAGAAVQVELIQRELRAAEVRLARRAERLSDLIERAQSSISRFQSESDFSRRGESLILTEPIDVPQLDVPQQAHRSGARDGRSEEERTHQAEIGDLVASGTDPQQISEMTGRPIGEILVIASLLQRKREEST